MADSKMDAFRNAIRAVFPELNLNIGSNDWNRIPKGKDLGTKRAAILAHVIASGAYDAPDSPETMIKVAGYASYIDTFRVSLGTGKRGNSDKTIADLRAQLAALIAAK